jgi:hypothetical protein
MAKLGINKLFKNFVTNAPKKAHLAAAASSTTKSVTPVIHGPTGAVYRAPTKPSARATWTKGGKFTSAPQGATVFNPKSGRYHHAVNPTKTNPLGVGKFAKGPGMATVAPPPKNPAFFAQHGKKVAAGVVAGGVIGGYAKNRTGKAVDPSTGLPRGVYGY